MISVADADADADTVSLPRSLALSVFCIQWLVIMNDSMLAQNTVSEEPFFARE